MLVCCWFLFVLLTRTDARAVTEGKVGEGGPGGLLLLGEALRVIALGVGPVLGVVVQCADGHDHAGSLGYFHVRQRHLTRRRGLARDHRQRRVLAQCLCRANKPTRIESMTLSQPESAPGAPAAGRRMALTTDTLLQVRHAHDSLVGDLAVEVHHDLVHLEQGLLEDGGVPGHLVEREGGRAGGALKARDCEDEHLGGDLVERQPLLVARVACSGRGGRVCLKSLW